jgi:hypothetical protein
MGVPEGRGRREWEARLVNRKGVFALSLSLLKNIDYGIFEIAEEAGCLRAEVWKETSVD